MNNDTVHESKPRLISIILCISYKRQRMLPMYFPERCEKGEIPPDRFISVF